MTLTLKEKIFNKINEEGSFICTFCSKCNTYNWPPNYNCKKCFNNTRLKKIKNKGIVLEKSYSHLSDQKSFFGIGDFSGIRVLGTMDRQMSVNDLITIYKAAIIENKISIIFKKIQK